jgi:hypothetical protein
VTVSSPDGWVTWRPLAGDVQRDNEETMTESGKLCEQNVLETGRDIVEEMDD